MKELVFSPAEMVLAKEKIIGAFGLARRAGKCQIGSEICVEQIRISCALFLLSNNLSTPNITLPLRIAKPKYDLTLSIFNELLL